MKEIIYTALLFIGFAAVHSLLVLSPIKESAARLFGPRFVKAFYRLIYSTISGILFLITVYIFFNIPDVRLWRQPPLVALAMAAIQITGLLLGLLSFRDIDAWEFIGVRQAWRHLKKRELAGEAEGLTGGLATTGIYGRVRHPLYIAGILIFTFQPYITRNMLVISALADVYFILGAFIEEKRLLKAFGEEYRDYMKRVPRFLPRIRA